MMLPLGALQVFQEDVANQHVPREVHAIGMLHQARNGPVRQITTDRLATISGRQWLPPATSRSSRIQALTHPRAIPVMALYSSSLFQGRFLRCCSAPSSRYNLPLGGAEAVPSPHRNM